MSLAASVSQVRDFIKNFEALGEVAGALETALAANQIKAIIAYV